MGDVDCQCIRQFDTAKVAKSKKEEKKEEEEALKENHSFIYLIIMLHVVLSSFLFKSDEFMLIISL